MHYNWSVNVIETSKITSSKSISQPLQKICSNRSQLWNVKNAKYSNTKLKVYL
jgi:hypothetical protein